MLSIRDPHKNKISTQAKSEGIENIYSKQMDMIKKKKPSWGSNTYIKQNKFQNKGHIEKQRTPHNT